MHLRMPCSTLNTFPPWSAVLTLAQIPTLIIRSDLRCTSWRKLACFVTKYLPPKSDIFPSWFVYFEKRCVCRRGERIAGSALYFHYTESLEKSSRKVGQSYQRSPSDYPQKLAVFPTLEGVLVLVFHDSDRATCFTVDEQRGENEESHEILRRTNNVLLPLRMAP